MHSTIHLFDSMNIIYELPVNAYTNNSKGEEPNNILKHKILVSHGYLTQKLQNQTDSLKSISLYFR